MEQSIADLLKDAFSEDNILDFEDLQSDEGNNTSQTHPVMDEDMDDGNGASKLWTRSERGSVQTFPNVYEQEETEVTSDNSESESSNSFSINTEATFCLSHVTDNDQVVNTIMTEAQQLNYTVRECTAEEGNMQSDLAAGVSTHGLVTGFSIMGDEKELTEEKHMETFNVEYQQQTSPPTASESQTPEETSSESDEELPENYSTTEPSSQCESVGNKDELFLAMSPNIADKYCVRDDMKEFTEEDQEQIEESLADYPSDFSHSETEEPTENATAQTFTLVDISSSDDHSTDRMEDLSNAENVNLQNKDSPALDHNSGIKDLEVEMISASVDLDLSFQRGNFDEEDVQESLTNDRTMEEDAKNKDDAGDLSDVNDQADYSDSSSDVNDQAGCSDSSSDVNDQAGCSDSSSDDHSTSQEETNFPSSVKQEEEKNHVTQHNYATEDMMRMDNDIDYICPDTGDGDANSPEKQDVGRVLFSDVEERGFTNTSSISYYEESNTEPTESHRSIESVQSDAAIKDHDKSSSEASDNVGDTKNIISEVLWSSALLMDEDNLLLDEYDWDMTGEDSLKINSGEGENQEYTEEALEELDIYEDEEGNERDWELEKTRIEAFYRFYGDQAEPEDKVGRNHKVTFCLDHESSEYDEDSDSTEEELDSDLNTPDLNTLKPEYHSESDDPLEKPYYPERSRMQPKEQQPVSAAVKQHPHRSKCLAVLKSTLAFGLLTAIGIVSYWWATENLDWIH
ncbi:serine-aspartate repeat-containing protein F isoform X2 [Pangasianodon hypophthalmus]|uniref:serine-aspartate repeat-containing protein F isoform X2 n=1 Tax=Pangasianodon hypophthalmus TaxID=310915 RepID=UPI002307CEB2|nr:serine-aspartate repeat-containing protein F isoform X2 [Pangasianodon hypophthalmus]